jgi:hypothetical protein
VAARRQTIPERVTVFKDAQAAIQHTSSEEPGPGQGYAIQARKWITALRKAGPDIIIEVRWWPAHQGVVGNEEADKWARLAAKEPDTHGVEWLGFADRYGRRSMPLPGSLANIKREISQKKWAEVQSWAEGRITSKKYRLPREQRPNRVVERCPKRLASRFYQLKTGHCLTGQYLKWSKSCSTAGCGWCSCRVQTREHLFKNCPRWKPQQKILWAEVRRATGRGKNRFKIRDLFADERCTRPILDFLRTTEVGRRTGPRDEERAGEGGREGYKNDFSLFSFRFCMWDRPGGGQGELPRAACGLTEVGADGEQDWTVYNLTMIQ